MRRSVKFPRQKPRAAEAAAAAASASRQAAYGARRYRAGPRPYSSQELKFADTVLNDADLDDDGSITLLNGLTTGTSAVQRIGRKIVIKSVEVHGYFRPAAAAVIPVATRIILLLDKQANGVAPTLNQILERSGDTYSAVSPRNLANRDRFQCLKEFYATLNASTGGAGVGQDNLKRFDWYLRCNIPVIYNDGVAATVADISSNALYLVAASGVATGNASVPQVLFYARIRFAD